MSWYGNAVHILVILSFDKLLIKLSFGEIMEGLSGHGCKPPLAFDKINLIHLFLPIFVPFQHCWSKKTLTWIFRSGARLEQICKVRGWEVAVVVDPIFPENVFWDICIWNILRYFQKIYFKIFAYEIFWEISRKFILRYLHFEYFEIFADEIVMR